MDELQGIVVALGVLFLGLWGLQWVYDQDVKRDAAPKPPAPGPAGTGPPPAAGS